ncbi:MAG: hypothetical protein DRN21_05230 [Thermoplasmata archaeon]|nr:MAG: hypothetical protein DRN21_05230 [Thermoplasmata archaeon]
MASPISMVANFWAAWRPPSNMIAPVIEEPAQQYPGRPKFCRLGVNSVAATQYGIMTIPTLQLFKQRKPVD